MKLVVALTLVSVAVMTVMILQTLRQELQLRHLKTRTVEHLAEAKRGEKTITLIKKQNVDLKTNLASITGRVEELKKRKAAAEKAEQDQQKSLQECGKEKESAQNNTKATVEAINELKAEHAEEKRKAEDAMQKVKQHILDRDKALCIFADPSFAEVKTLCGNKAPQ
ncbi:uncharacterized protein LOC144057220 [Vanacampus margaritifer]